MRRLSVDCDGCARTDVGEVSEVYVYLSRKPGEMDAGAVNVALCHRCAVHFLTKMIAISAKNGVTPCDEDFVKFVRDNRVKEPRK